MKGSRRMKTEANGESVITILESDLGPLISESRASVYDVMEADDEGYAPSDIGKIYNLSPHQVQVALAYIAQHREQLAPELKELLIKKAERERYYRTLAEEIKRQHPVPMTPQRAAVYALIEKSRQTVEEVHADHSQRS